MYPYFVANITITNVEKLKIMATVSSVPKKPSVGYTYIWYLSVPSILRMYLCSVWVCTPCTCHTHLFCHMLPSLTWIFRGHDYVNAHTFRRNIRTRASVHAHNISRNVRARAYAILCACGAHERTYEIFCASASTIILAHTSACLCVCAQDSASIHACAPAIISARGGCSLFMYVVLSNTILWDDLGHGSRKYDV